VADAPTVEETESQISREILRVHEETYGYGASSVMTRVIDDVVLVVLDVDLSQAEQALIDGGRGDAVKSQREAFQEVIGPTFKAIVERATGRQVDVFMSHMNVDPVFSVELFRLRPL
jgi:uncharacterized protein YbcI